jgi:uncharacterized flavoprotein (TIGR03862 family)
MKQAVVIGGGPAGLMAADMLLQSGVAVTLVDAMPSLGRKFLMAGKSGLNLTKVEAAQDFAAAFHPYPAPLSAALDAFGPPQVMAWAEALGVSLFTGSTGRVFPDAMKASPLLRAWLARLQGQGLRVLARHRWVGWSGQDLICDTRNGPVKICADVTVLALGGASWRRLGSDGAWTDLLPPHSTVPFAPANVGFSVAWSDHMTPHMGKPVKAVALHAGGQISRGEWVISREGIEGGGIYALGRVLRAGAALTLDLCPDRSVDTLRQALARPRGKASMSNHLRKVLRLDPVRLALLAEWGRPFPDDLAPLIKRLPVPILGPRPLDQAISTAGGLAWSALTDTLMLRDRPGTFCAGEMLDWEAPTGGYLLTACLATGRLAGSAAAGWLAQQGPSGT